jgi:hypothetical protein
MPSCIVRIPAALRLLLPCRAAYTTSHSRIGWDARQAAEQAACSPGAAARQGRPPGNTGSHSPRKAGREAQRARQICAIQGGQNPLSRSRSSKQNPGPDSRLQTQIIRTAAH